MKRRHCILRCLIALVGIAGFTTLSASHYQSVDGVEIYLGLIPAAMVSSNVNMHGGLPRRENAYHLTVALFETDSGARLQNGRVEAQVAPIGLEDGRKKRLEPMVINDTITFGEYFILDLSTVYRIRVRVDLPGRGEALEAIFEHDSRSSAH